MVRNGKIALLPTAVRELLNYRLEENHPGNEILTWLNALPETKEIVKNHFDGKPVSKQNLSEWRQGGFEEWQMRYLLTGNLRDAAFDAAVLDGAAPLMAEKAAKFIGARLLLTSRKLNGQDDDDATVTRIERQIKLLQSLDRIRRTEQR